MNKKTQRHPACPNIVLNGLSGGEVTAEFLLQWEVPFIFGLAGSEETGFLDALIDRPQLRYITGLHESAVMAMADGFARATGQTAFVQLHSVAGAAYALGQMITSSLDHIPVVIAVGRQSTNFRGHGGFLESPGLTELPRNYAQWTWDVMNVNTIPDVMRRAFLLAEAPPGGPTFVTFSKDLWEKPVDRVEIIPRSRSLVDQQAAPSDSHISAIVDNLLAAKRPLIFLGNECIKYEISDDIAAIAEATGAMVMVSIKGPCVFPTTHPHFVGEILDDAQLLEDVDCVWSVGGHMFKTFNLPEQPVISHAATIMHTSQVSADIGRNYPVDEAAFANIQVTAQLVRGNLLQRAAGTIDSNAVKQKNAWITAYTSEQRRRLDAVLKKEWDCQPIATSRLMAELNQVMAADAEIVSELITSDHYPRQYLDFDHRVSAASRRRNHYPTSGVLGWGVGAAVGTKLGFPDKEVWCLVGDGCFNFGSQALWSAARYQCAIGVVIFNNGEYQANRLNQNVYRGRIQQTGQPVGADLGNPDIDYSKMAAAYGVEAECVTEPDQLAAALQRCKQAMAAGKPYLVDVKIAKAS